MQIEIPLPSLGDEDDAVQTGTVAFWLAETGAELKEGDDLLELTTDKAAFVVPAPQAGRLAERRVKEGDAIRVGDILGILETV